MCIRDRAHTGVGSGQLKGKAHCGVLASGLEHVTEPAPALPGANCRHEVRLTRVESCVRAERGGCGEPSRVDVYYGHPSCAEDSCPLHGEQPNGARTQHDHILATSAVSYTHLRAHETVLDLV